jgi:cytochrome b subunit of formate dehydrogenase
MTLFRYAQDYYGGWLPVQLLPQAAALIIWASILFMGLHLLRRSRGEPLSGKQDDSTFPGIVHVHKYTLGQRLYHWGNFIFLGVLAVSGIALFVPRSLKNLSYSWLLIHEVFAALFIGGLVVHILAALTRGEPRTMWFEQKDWKDIRDIVSNFFGRSQEYPLFGKYDPLQKLYHALLTGLCLGLIFSGTFLWLSAENLTTFSHNWMRWQRLIHDLFSFLLIAFVLGHTYFGIIRINWPSLVAISLGRLKAEHFRRRHSQKRWKPTPLE